MLILFPHAGDACAARHQVKRLIGEGRAGIRIHLAPMSAQPLLQLDAHFSFDGGSLGARLNASNQI